MIQLEQEDYRPRWEILSLEDTNLLLGFSYGQYYSNHMEDNLTYSMCCSIQELLSAFYCCGVPFNKLRRIAFESVEQSLRYFNNIVDNNNVEIQAIALLFRNINLVIKFNLIDYRKLAIELLDKFSKSIVHSGWVSEASIFLYKMYLYDNKEKIRNTICNTPSIAEDTFLVNLLETIENPKRGINMLVNDLTNVLEMANSHYLRNKQTHFLNRIIRFREISYFLFDPTLSMLNVIGIKFELEQKYFIFFPELEG